MGGRVVVVIDTCEREAETGTEEYGENACEVRTRRPTREGRSSHETSWTRSRIRLCRQGFHPRCSRVRSACDLRFLGISGVARWQRLQRGHLRLRFRCPGEEGAISSRAPRQREEDGGAGEDCDGGRLCGASR